MTVSSQGSPSLRSSSLDTALLYRTHAAARPARAGSLTGIRPGDVCTALGPLRVYERPRKNSGHTWPYTDIPA
jgi:hypothetical protein